MTILLLLSHQLHPVVKYIRIFRTQVALFVFTVATLVARSGIILVLEINWIYSNRQPERTEAWPGKP